MANMNLKKNPMPTQDALVRARNFDEVALGYDEATAIDEALRCLSCKNMPCVGGCPVNIHIPEFIDKIKVGDFEGAFRWGYADQIPMEVIQFGDPDGQGDLKRTNEVVLRAEAWIGWGILDKEAFGRVVTGV